MKVDIPAGQWPELSRLFDEACQLTTADRERWLGTLPTDAAALEPALRAMLDSHDRAESSNFLGELRLEPPLAPVDVAVLAPGAVVGAYVIDAEAGRGGMGIVYRARRTDTLVNRPVALKLLHPGLQSREIVERFARERDILAGLTHPNIARLYDAGATASGQPFIALEYVEGLPIPAYCDHLRLGLRARLEIFCQALRAVQFAHANLVIHRDLKPSNILVAAGGEVRLLDFGIAKLLQPADVAATAATLLELRALTPDYASPEQILGGTVSTASDVYSLGVVLYELLCGARPYQLKRASAAALEEAILGTDSPRPSQAAISPAIAQARTTTVRLLRRDLAGDLDTIVLKALKKAPADRYATADAFEQDIRRYLAGEAVQAQPDSTWYRTRKFLTRNRLAVLSGSAAILAVAVGFGMAVWQAGVANQQTRLARTEAQTAEAVEAFLQAIFKTNSANQADPLTAQKTSARELLDIGAQRIQSGLAGAPAAKLKVLATLADLYDDLNVLSKEVELSRERVRVARSNFGPRSPELADALVDLATADSKAAHNVEADQALAEARRILDARGDVRSVTRAKYEIDIGNRLYDTEAGQALAHIDQGIRLLRASPPSIGLIDALSLKAAVENHVSHYAAAAAAAEEAADLAQRPELEARSYLPFCYTELASARAAQEDLAGAEDSFRRALQESVSRFGPENLQTLRAEDGLGNFLLGASHIRESVTVLRHAHDEALRIAAAGDTSSLPSYAMYRYARALTRSGRFEAALAIFDKIDAMRAGLETRADLRASLLERRAEALLEFGRGEVAARLLDEAAAIRGRIGQRHTALYNSQALLRAEAMLRRKDFAAAAQALEETVVDPVPAGAVSRQQLDLAVVRAQLSLAAGRSDEALATSESALALIRQTPARGYLTLWEARASAVAGRARLQRRDLKAALPLLRRSADLSAALFDGEASAELADVELSLAECLLELGSAEEATALVTAARRILGSHAELDGRYTRRLRDFHERTRQGSSESTRAGSAPRVGRDPAVPAAARR